jgi:hypothetical protein
MRKKLVFSYNFNNLVILGAWLGGRASSKSRPSTLLRAAGEFHPEEISLHLSGQFCVFCPTLSVHVPKNIGPVFCYSAKYEKNANSLLRYVQ